MTGGEAHERQGACAQAVTTSFGGRSPTGTSLGEDTKGGAVATGWLPEIATKRWTSTGTQNEQLEAEMQHVP